MKKKSQGKPQVKGPFAGKDIPGVTRYPTLKEQGELIRFPWNLACYSKDSYLRWYLPVHDKKTLKLLRLMWEAHEGRCEVSKSSYSCREFWCRRVIFKRDGEVFHKTWFASLLQISIWRYLWAMRGRVKDRSYELKVLIKAREIAMYGGKENVPELKLGYGEADGLKLNSAQKRALKAFRKDDDPPF